MAVERERKFLVESDAWRGEVAGARAIRQFYLLARPGCSLRVRLEEGRATMTLKSGASARAREEFECPLPQEDARRMEKAAVGSVIEKTRHLVRHGGHLYEVDEFGGSLSGLVIAELETAEDVADADLPAWLGREITDIGAYYNASLATHGLPETTE